MSESAPSLYVYFDTAQADEAAVLDALRALLRCCAQAGLPAPRIERRPPTAARRTWMLVWSAQPREPELAQHCDALMTRAGLAALAPQGWHVERFAAVDPTQSAG